ncbi:hypothetical protein ACHAXS_001722 [Conticribra weissflogii]
MDGPREPSGTSESNLGKFCFMRFIVGQIVLIFVMPRSICKYQCGTQTVQSTHFWVPCLWSAQFTSRRKNNSSVEFTRMSRSQSGSFPF